MRSSTISKRDTRPKFGLAKRLLFVLALIAGVSTSIVSGAQSNDDSNDDIADIREQRREAQEAAAAKAGSVDAANAEVSELTAALDALQANVVAKELELADAQRQLSTARETRANAEEAVRAAKLEIVILGEKLAARAVTSFINQDSATSLFVQAGDPTQAVRMHGLVEELTQSDADIADSLKSAKEDLAVEEAIASNAAAEAERLEVLTSTQLTDLTVARDAQNQITAEAEDRLDHLLGELYAIQELDKELARKESAKLEQLAAALARKRSQGGGGGQRTSEIPIPPNSEIVKASGFWVHQSIADSVSAMISAASADGINLGGGGWRDSANQIRLRRAHCGSSDYAVYEMSASRCRPPTARPGSSMHERGLALDLTYNGRLIGTRNNEGFRWLAANAASYGFKNLPSEPWHWSTNGS